MLAYARDHIFQEPVQIWRMSSLGTKDPSVPAPPRLQAMPLSPVTQTHCNTESAGEGRREGNKPHICVLVTFEVNGKVLRCCSERLMVSCRIEQNASIISAHKELRDPQVKIII